MNVDTQFTYTPVTAASERPVKSASEQLSTRPAEHPTRAETPDNRAEQNETSRNLPTEAQQAAAEQPTHDNANQPGYLLDVIV